MSAPPPPELPEPDAGLELADGTIVPLMHGAHDPSETFKLGQAPSSTGPSGDGPLPAPAAPVAPLTFERELGRGGMGVVRLALDGRLGRRVAVKSLRPDKRDETGVWVRRLLQEAWVIGALEHPNILPVYEITFDAEGQPHVLLKRIDGESWQTLLDHPAQVALRAGGDDPLVWHLRVLMTVCTAVHFAHAKGFLHRDLKPDNVMIGAHGEVYTLDWGLAVQLHDDGSGRFPLAAQATQVVGTPRYMAPEMLRGDGKRLGPQTDVYLLGAMLHQVLVGHAPHQGDEVMAVLSGIPTFVPTFPESVPADLARLCTACLQVQPKHRPQSAEAVRAAIQAHLDHRGPVMWARQAEESLRALERMAADTDADAADVHARFGAVRFAYTQALRDWPETPGAAAGLRQALVVMATHELDAGDTRAARLLLDELGDAPAALRERCAALEAEQAAGAARAAALAADRDPALGNRTRSFITAVLTASWTVIPLVLWWLDPPIGLVELSVFNAVMLAIIVALGVWARESMLRTGINRTVLWGLVLVPVTQQFIVATTWLMGLDAMQALTLFPLVWAVIPAAHVLELKRGTLVPSVTFAGLALVVAWRPGLLWPAAALGNVVLAVTALVVWRPWAVERVGR